MKFSSVSGDVDQGGGLVWRAKDAKNYYICRYNPLESNYGICKVVDGRRTQLQSVVIDPKAGWHTLTVTMKDGQMKCTYDGKPYLYITEDTFAEADMIGLCSKADAVTHFDDLSVRG